MIAREQERQATAAAIRDFAVRTPSAEQRVAFLSGGNQQKVILGRWTRGTPKIYMFDEPTQGVDVATKLEIYRRLRELASGAPRLCSFPRSSSNSSASATGST